MIYTILIAVIALCLTALSGFSIGWYRNSGSVDRTDKIGVVSLIAGAAICWYLSISMLLP